VLLDISGLRLNVVEEGKGHPILFLSGLGGSWQDWEPQLDGLSDRYRCIAVDLRCHGRSDSPPGELSVELWADDIAALCEALGLTHVYVVGLSLGGMIAQVLGLARPDLVDAAVFACTMAKHEDATIQLAQIVLDGIGQAGTAFWVSTVCAGLEQKMSDPFVVRMLRNVASNDPDTLLRGLPAVLGHDVWDALKAFDRPALVVHGGNDPGVPVEHSKAMAQILPRGEIQLLDNASHFANVDQPLAFNAAVRAFFDRHPCPSEPAGTDKS
jgi:3-oxoadipate enol-lactonase